MSEQNQTAPAQQGEGEAPAQAGRTVEVATGPLIPRWLLGLIYGVFVPFCVFGFYYIGRAIAVQQRIGAELRLIYGPWQGEPPPLDSPAVREAIDYLKRRPRNGLLYVIQQLMQDELKDPRELLANMNLKGQMEPDYRLAPEYKRTLEELLAERRAHPSTSYEEQKITEVLEWLADGRPTPAKGPERRRLAALRTAYEKKLLSSAEKRLLRTIMGRWEQSDNPTQRSATSKFALMLEGKPTELSPEEKALCQQRADEWEALFLRGRVRITQVGVELAKAIQQRQRWLDHPELWDLVSLLHERCPEARRNLMEIVYTLRARKFTLVYLREFILKDSVNPVMAVETARLTKSEHEELLREENHRRRIACIELARRIALDYCAEPFQIQGVQAEGSKDFFKANILRPLEAVVEDKEVGTYAQAALDALEQACADLLR